MKQRRLILLGLLLGVINACASATEPRLGPLPSDVASFVSSLPKLRSASTVVSVPEQDLTLFKASYGDPHDCPAGCFYDQAWGLKYAGQIGWIEGAPPSEKRYDVKPTDQYLFNDSLLDRLQQEWIGAGFRIMLACDTDTPTAALERLADRLPADGWPFFAELLLEVAQRRDARHVAEIIANLGASPYDFSYSRQHAASLLTNWPSQPATHLC